MPQLGILGKLNLVRTTAVMGLPASLLAKFLFLWTGKFDGDNLLSDLDASVITVTNSDFASTFIPGDTAATFATPDNATYIAADGVDDFWFSAGNVLQQKTLAQLIASTTTRTFIKYADFDPYNVSIIGILKTGEVLTTQEKTILNRYFKLWVEYWGVIMMNSGYMKDNRTFSVLTDIDGNIYSTIIIGSQEWIVENLRTTKYADGSSIPIVTNDAAWAADAAGAMCYYNNDKATNEIPYGALYNWFAFVNVAGLAYFERFGAQETGWRIPTDADFVALNTFLGASGVGGLIKEEGLAHWNTPNEGASNSSGLTLVGSGTRQYDAPFYGLKESCDLWTTLEQDVDTVWTRGAVYTTPNMAAALLDKNTGCAVRCVRDL